MVAHLQQGSVRGAKGDAVRAGQELGKCGNSGNSTQPHLHIQVQTTPKFTTETRTFPIVWRGVARVRGKAETADRPVDVRRNDWRRARPLAQPVQ